jgi:single-stranded-DNA-specific exonuclease
MIKWVLRGDAAADGPTLIDRLLRARGFTDPLKAQAFLHPSRTQLLDPFLMPDMRAAVERVVRARDENRTVVVYGDYDVDGVTATAILTSFLDAFGVRARHYIPSRHKEGYGLNADAIRSIAENENAPLLITVDCGVTAVQEIALAKALGLDPVVTDHHRPGEQLPDCPVLNPLLGYPESHLCGAGVAFKLCQALNDDLAFSFIDLAALGTVADVVPLVGENRAITWLGLSRMNEAPRPGIAALMEKAGVAPGAVTSGKIAFQLAPRLNAGGRVGDAVRSLRLLTARSPEEAKPLAAELEDENRERKTLEGQILSGAQKQLSGFDFAARRVLILAGDDWNVGVLGLAASRLVEKHHLPTVLMNRKDGVLHGSCRSIPGVDIFEMLGCVSHHLTRFGGHSQAAGLTLPEENFEAFTEALNEVIAREADPECFVPAARYDLSLPLSLLDEAFVRSLALFEPTGFGNPAPVFMTEANVASREAVGADRSHLRLRLEEGGRNLPGIAFSMGSRAEALPSRVRALYAPQIGRFNGREYLECQVKAIGQSGYLDAFLAAKPDFDGLFQTFLTNRLYNKAYSMEPAGVYRGFDGVFSSLQASPRGTLVLAVGEETARTFLEAAEAAVPCRMDVLAGSYPSDARAFNAFCLLPTGTPPARYDRVFSLDTPSAFWGFPVLEAGETTAPIPFPDVDDLRSVYVLARDLASRPNAAASLQQIVRDLAAELGFSAATVFAGLTVLHDMGLVALAEKKPWLTLRPNKKADPKENSVFQWMRQLSRRGGEPLDV